MEQIDAETAVKILVAVAPLATEQPIHKAMRFIEEAARRGGVQVRAFRGHATDRREAIPAVEVADLAFYFMAHAGKVDDTLGEADLVTAGWGTFCQGPLGGVDQTVWRNVRFLRHEIEGARADFLASLEGREIEPDTLPLRKRKQSMQAGVEQFLARLYKDGPPEWWDWPLTRFDKELRKLRNFGVGIDTIKRARREVTKQASKGN
jgi:hypothetical protein